MKTKHFLLAAGIALALAFTFSACSSEEPSNNQNNNGGINNGKNTVNCLIWEYCYDKSEDDPFTYDECLEYGGTVVSSCSNNNNNNGGNNNYSSSNGGNNNKSSSSVGNNNTVTTKPAAPANVSAELFFGIVKVSWSSVSGAESYEIYRSTTATGSYSKIGTVTGAYSTSYEDNSSKDGDNYYKIIAVNKAGNSDYSSYAYIDFSFEPCLTGITATAGTKNAAGFASITIKWTISTAKGCGKPTSITCHGEADGIWTNTSVSATATSCNVSSAGVNSSNCFKYAVDAEKAKGKFSYGNTLCK